jgi:hypothetical protein
MHLPELRDGGGFVADIWFRVAVFSLGALSILLAVAALFMD